ncbi:hypothetical protein BYT27DRAFT_7195959 [Phlegmacium glaucopus]|nr:hypothetical protein BYT27DRAFT_7195959 [Phlegmacium glaucopus]
MLVVHEKIHTTCVMWFHVRPERRLKVRKTTRKLTSTISSGNIHIASILHKNFSRKDGGDESSNFEVAVKHWMFFHMTELQSQQVQAFESQ